MAKQYSNYLYFLVLFGLVFFNKSAEVEDHFPASGDNSQDTGSRFNHHVTWADFTNNVEGTSRTIIDSVNTSPGQYVANPLLPLSKQQHKRVSHIQKKGESDSDQSFSSSEEDLIIIAVFHTVFNQNFQLERSDIDESSWNKRDVDSWIDQQLTTRPKNQQELDMLVYGRKKKKKTSPGCFSCCFCCDISE